jgi:IS30 family transposase
LILLFFLYIIKSVIKPTRIIIRNDIEKINKLFSKSFIEKYIEGNAKRKTKIINGNIVKITFLLYSRVQERSAIKVRRRGGFAPSSKTVLTCKVLLVTTQPQEAVMKKNNPNKEKKYSHLNNEEREELAIGLEIGLKQYVIAKLLGRSPSTISRELKRNHALMKTVRYRAYIAQYQYDERKRNSHKRHRIPNKRLRRYIWKMIRKGYSPEIVPFIAAEKNRRWKTNHETIYQWIYTEQKDLIPFLVHAHKKRRKRGSAKQKRCPKVLNRTMIDKRPDYINLRKRIGDWETDTIISRQSKASVMILANRRSRKVILKKLCQKTAIEMHKSHVKCLKDFPHHLRNSITYDNGTENALHELTNKILGTKSYFCNPYHSWERGTVENLIGLVRRFYPKKTDWNNITQWDLNKVAHFINNRPMKCLGFKSPNRVHIALAA